MTEDSRKRLTGYLGECWHRRDRDAYCEACGHHSCMESNRSFTTWPDLGALVTAMDNKGEWSEFEEYAFLEWHKLKYPGKTLTHFLMGDPTRFCELVDKWLEGKEKVWIP